MNNDINNKKVDVPTGMNLNDKDYLTTLLTFLKDMEKNLAVCLTEASNENLYKEFKTMFDEYATFQRKAYELMFKFGWYKLEKVTKTKLTTLLTNLETEITDLN